MLGELLRGQEAVVHFKANILNKMALDLATISLI